MPLSTETQELLDLAFEKVAAEGYNVAGFCMSKTPPEFFHFSAPERSRATMAKMVETWLEILRDEAICSEQVQAPTLYQA
jgi:hypothetical protein